MTFADDIHGIMWPQQYMLSFPLQVGILQFSNDVRVELPPQVVEQEVFNKKLETMVRPLHTPARRQPSHASDPQAPAISRCASLKP